MAVKTISQIIEEVTKQKGPLSEHKLVYDSSSDTLEPIYFYIIDLMNDMGLGMEKLVDNFVSTPGSGHFAELGQRATIMQQQASKIMGDVNTVLRSVLNIVYDLKDFRIRLQHYDKLKSKDKNDKEAAILSLKQIWMDKVDITKGNSSIKAMASTQGGFQTLIHAFLSVNDVKEVDKIELNDMVKRILKPRIQEFNIWMEQSEQELRKRYELEKTYLRSQVNSLKLYSRWVRPYLAAAQQLEMKESGRNPSLVKTFNTIFLELTVLGKRALNVEGEIGKGNLSVDFGKERVLNKLRKYYSCFLVDFTFRGIPQRVSQQAHYTFGGRTDVSFKCYVMNEDELAKFEEAISHSEIEEVLKLIEGTTEESLGKLQEDINFFLEEKTEEEKKKETDTSNPFFALIGKYNEPEKEAKGGKGKAPVVIRPESFIEKEYLRKLAVKNGKDAIFDIFDIYKKAHGMPSYT
ncbi:MAG TPA: hypothetical protein VMC07_00825 [Candidatus Omnitrophota bacterium]|nr:hypothetical protein [Candidatus Omnitrophota bacterium]